MVNELQNLTQTQRVAELLAEIAKDITAENRKEITQKLSISNTTLSKYLNGKVADVETGIGILQYCRAILVRREKDIAA